MAMQAMVTIAEVTKVRIRIRRLAEAPSGMATMTPVALRSRSTAASRFLSVQLDATASAIVVQ